MAKLKSHPRGFLFVFLCIVFLALTVGSSHLSAGRPTPGNRPSILEFSFEMDSSKVRIHHNTDSGFDEITYEGLSAFSHPDYEGAPMIPVIKKTVLLPARMRVVSLSVLPRNPVLIADDVLPRPIPSLDNNEHWEPSPSYYGNGGSFPPRFEILSSNGGYREISLASFAAFPFEWRADNGELYLYQSLQIAVNLAPISDNEGAPARLRPERRFSRGLHELNWARENVMNPAELEIFYPIQESNEPDFHNAVAETLHATGFDPTDLPSLQGSPVDMVIVTGRSWASGSETGDMVAAFQDWADWRTITGIPTVVRSLGWVRGNYHGTDDQERIREFLKDAYSLWGTDFVILGGDVEVIPSRASLYELLHIDGQDPSSDWYYAGLDSDWDQDDDGFYSWTTNVDLYPELWIGRIPARDSVEVSEILTKLKTYERIPNLSLDVPTPLCQDSCRFKLRGRSARERHNAAEAVL